MAIDPSHDAWVADFTRAETTLAPLAPLPRLVHVQVPRKPLQRLQEALDKPKAQLVVVDGAKCLEIAAEALPKQAVVTWAEGSFPQDADWPALAVREDKRAVVWPSNSDESRVACSIAAEELAKVGYQVRMVHGEQSVIDTIKAGTLPQEYARAHAKKWAPKVVEDVLPPEPPPPEDDPPGEVIPAEPKGKRRQPPVRDGIWVFDDWRNAGLEMANNKPVANLSNVGLVLDVIRAGQIWYDTFLQKILTVGGDGKVREWTDADDIRLTIELQRRCRLVAVNKKNVADAVVEFARRDLRDELVEYLESLEWDGTPRIEYFFVDICWADRSPYTLAVGRNFFLSAVARATRPGCQVDSMVTLEGKQGAGKSRLVEALGGPWYAIMREAPHSKDFEIALRGKWIIEVAELDSFSRAENSAVKRTLSTAVDRYRAPYGVHAEDHPRRSVFVGTVNSNEWLSDATGARRFFPIACDRIELDLARDNRDQYFAEAMHLLKSGADWWTTPERETRKVQRNRYIEDPWQDAVLHAVKGVAQVRISKVLEDIGVPTERMTRLEQMRVAAILKSNGWTCTPLWVEGRSVRTWVKDRNAD
jgi:predicted P-loop ATPase